MAGLEFHTAVLTNLTQDHLDYHGDMDAYFEVKSRLFSWGQGPKHRVVNCDDRYGRRLTRLLGDGVMGYGLAHDCPEGPPSLKGELVSCDGRGIRMNVTWGAKTFPVASPLVGRHNAENLLAAVGAGLSLGLGCREFKSLEDFAGVPGRLERVDNDRGLSIFVDYAHTPDALTNVLTTLRALDFKRLIAVFGCGGNRDKAKRPLMARAVAQVADVCVLTSDNPRFEKPGDIIADALPGLDNARETLVIEDRSEAIDAAVALMKPGDCLLVAGKGHETYQETLGLRRHFSDVEAVRRALTLRGERQA
jgi:UDP-N-acetylmuramoyl-L-alanyl-D-glutamate--2,6-diaminopimelate ligase